MERARAGDREAFATLATEVYARFHRVAYTILRDRELALDAVQSAMLSAWRELPRLRDVDRFEAWSYRLLVNACYAESRTRTRHRLPNLFREPEERAAFDDIGAFADRDQLERGFRELSVDQRAVVVLHHLADQPLPRVAEILGIPEGTARSRLQRAMEALRAALEADARRSGPTFSATMEGMR
ncbi:MAG: sigma-70 family RNA polymerase sigma factor [Chloroflexota bacterium]